MGNGVLDLYIQRNENVNQNCNQHIQNVHALGFLKTASLFIILFSGTILSFSILIYECFKSPKKIATEEIKLKQYQMEICHTIDDTDLLSVEKRELLKKEMFILVENIQKTDVYRNSAGTKKNIEFSSKIQKSGQEFSSSQEV